MKKCPTCGKTFDDNMRFCQVDGTPLVDDAPAQPEAPPVEEAPFDPYATIVGVPKAAIPADTPAEASVEPPSASPAGEVVLEPIAPADEGPASSGDAMSGESAGSIPVAPPDDILELGNDPLKTMYVSDAEMKEVLGTAGSGGDTPSEEIKADEAEVEAPPAPDFGSMSPPPSPFSEPQAPEEAPVPPPPSFIEPAPPAFTEAETQFQAPEPSFQEAPTMYQSEPQFAPPPEPAPIQQQEWTPPPAPTPEWQNQQIGSNTPFQPPPAGTGGQNKTLAIISMVLGILSICCYTGWLTGIAALITGFMARKKAKEDPANYGGEGMALAGLICGGVFTLVSLIYWIIVVVFYGSMIASGGFR